MRPIRLYIIMVLILLGLPALSSAAITVDASSNVVTSTNTATTASWSHTVGAGSNRMLIVGVALVSASTTNYVTGISYGGSALTRIGFVNRIATILYRSELWYLLLPPSGTGTVTITLASGGSITAGAVSFAGVNLSNPLGAFVSANGNSKAALVNATTVAGDMVIDTMNTRGGRTVTVGAGQTIRWNPASAGGDGWAKGSGSTEPATGTTTAMSWTISKASNWTICAVPIKAALNAPTVAKSFSAVTIPVNGAANMTITLTNPNSAVISGAQFTDTYPSTDMKNNAAAPTTNTCGGTVSMLSGGSSLSLSNGSIPASGSCSIVVPVTATAAGTYLNSTGVVTSANALPGAAATATLTALAPPTAAKDFSPNTILINGASVLTITLTNPNAVAITGAAFSDTYPSTNLRNTSATPTTNTCGGTVSMTSGGSSLALSGGVIPASGSCAIVVPVTAIAAGTYLNSTGNITTVNAGTGTAATDTIIAVTSPTATKSFSPGTIPVNGAANLTITLINSNTTAITGVAFTDTYPSANMKNTAAAPTTNTCGGSVTMTNGGSSVALSGGVIPASGSCSIVVPVTATVAGAYLNSTGAITTDDAGTIAAASATLRAMDPPGVTKSFSPGSIPVNSAANMTITLTNPNTVAITGAAFTDTYPSTNMKNTAAAPTTNTCGGTVTMVSGGSSVALSGGVIPAAGSCSLVVPVTAVAGGTYLNSTGNVTTTGAGTGAAASATLTALAPPAAAKSFSPGTILQNGASGMTITLTNPNTTAITGAAFTDNYPTGITNTAAVPTTNTCGGTVTMANGGSSLALSGGAIPASGNCSIVVSVTAAAGGLYNNSTGDITTANAGTGTSASATLAVIYPPNIDKAFDPAVILPNGAATITFELSNINPTLIITGMAFTDTYPSASMRNTAASPTSDTCGGTVSMTNGGSSFAIANVTLAAGATCAIVVPVTATVTGNYLNSTGAVTSTNAGTGAADTDTLTVLAGASATKSFSPATIPTNGTSELKITLTNPNTTDLKQVAFTDTYPANMKNTASASPTNTCGGTLTAANNGTALALSGGTILKQGSCEITVNVTSAIAGSYLNSTGVITLQGGSIPAASATLTVKNPPRIALTKYVAPTVAAPGEEVVFSVWYRNIGDLPATYLIITDSVPLNTTYVAGSMKIGAASSTYASATPLTDAADADAGTVSGSTVYFSIPALGANDGAADGNDEGKVYFKVRIN